MRKVILFMHVSLDLDGFLAGPKGESGWTVTDEEMTNDLLADLIRTADTVLLGRVAYQELATGWPSVASNPSSSKAEVAFAHWISQAPKIVFSKTLEKVEWQHSRPSGQKTSRSGGSPALLKGGKIGLALVAEAKALEVLALGNGGLPSQFAPAGRVKLTSSLL